MTRTEKFLVAFLCAIVAGTFMLGAGLIWLNATRPGYVIDACPVIKP